MEAHCILMVEDEMCLAMMLGDILEDAGFRVVRASRLDDALQLVANTRIDAAILDVNLGGTPVFPLLPQLREREVPFVFATAYGHPGIPAEYADAPVLTKPYPPGRAVDALRRLISDAAAPPLH